MEACWEMHLQVVGDFWVAPIGFWQHFGKCPNSKGDIVVNAFRAVETFLEMPKLKWRPIGHISRGVSRCSHWLSMDEKSAKKKTSSQ
jgi:hypothetical protein